MTDTELKIKEAGMFYEMELERKERGQEEIQT